MVLAADKSERLSSGYVQPVNSALNQVNLSERVVAALRTAVGPGPVALHEPHFAGNEWRYLKECLDSTFVSSVGKFVDRFEAELADYTGAKHAVAVANGTAALHVALLLAGVEPNDEVLLPTLTFIATANAVSYCGAVTHFVDSRESDLGVDAAALREYLRDATELRDQLCVNRATGRIVRALVPMHAFGHPADMPALLEVAEEFRLKVVEDAAESLGSTLGGRHTGTFGLLGTLSFNGNKTITTGGGGAILTNDAALGKRAKHLTTTAKLVHRWEYRHDEIGFNYRMPNLNAALGCAQLEQLPRFVEAKRSLHARYAAAFDGMREVRLVGEPAGCHSNYWLQTLMLAPAAAFQRDAILAATNDCGFMTRPTWTLMHRLAPYASSPHMPLSVAESIERRLINIPSSPQLALAGPE